MTQHTPGPWDVAYFGAQFYVSSANSVGGKTLPPGSGRQAIASLPRGSKRDVPGYAEMFEANARLIAAAPDLLDALRTLMAASGEQLTSAFEQAQVALIKATGHLP